MCTGKPACATVNSQQRNGTRAGLSITKTYHTRNLAKWQIVGELKRVFIVKTLAHLHPQIVGQEAHKFGICAEYGIMAQNCYYHHQASPAIIIGYYHWLLSPAAGTKRNITALSTPLEQVG